MKRDADSLEKYISENRDRLDLLTPPPELTKRIIGATPEGRRRMLRRQLVIAACLTLLVAIPSVLFLTNNRPVQPDVAAYAPGSELHEAEIYYTRLMNSVFESADTLFRQAPALEAGIREDIGQLERIGEELRSDLKENVNNREVVEALVRNYRIRIQLLEELLEYIADDESVKAKTKGNGI